MSEHSSFTHHPWTPRPPGAPAALAPLRPSPTALREASLGRDRRASRFLYDEEGELLTRHTQDGTVCGASPAVQALLGCQPWRVEGCRWHEFVHPDDRRSFAEWWATLPEQAPTTLLYRLRGPDGSVVSVETLARRVVVVEPDVVEVHALTRDVTGHVERAAELTRQCEHLERRLDDLARRNESLARFAADAAHDLRAPLAAIAGFAELVSRHEGGRLDEMSQHFLAMLLATTGDMRTLLQAALDHGRATLGMARLSPVDCTRIVERACLRLHAEIAASGADVQVESLPVVHADGVQLGRVFQNLLSNACRSAPPGRAAHVVVSARQVGRGWYLSVTDDGIGVSPVERDRIFQLFHRGADAPADGGAGIGLAICRTIVESHGGRLWVEDARGGGSRFTFFLPEPD